MSKKISIKPGNFKGLGSTKAYKALKVAATAGLKTGVKPPRVVAAALGIDHNQTIHPSAMARLTDHPNDAVSAFAKKHLKIGK